MRPRSWLAVSAGTLAGSALATTGRPQSTARPTATAAHRRAPRTLTKIPARGLLAGSGGHMTHFAQAPNNGTITARSHGTGSVADKSGSRLSSGDLPAV